MNKLKTLATVVAVMGLLASCGISDLEDRVEKIEDGLGYDEPIKVSFTTTNYDDEVITEKGPFMFKGGPYTNGIYDYGDGLYYIWIQRYATLNQNYENIEYVEIGFYYDSNTDEVVEEGSFEMGFAAPDGDWLYPEFYLGADNQTFTINVKSFDPEAGSISLDFVGSSTVNYGNNEYEGHTMEVSGSFKGKLRYTEGD